MLIKKRPSWAMAEADATSEHIYLNRREWLRAAAAAAAAAVAAAVTAAVPTAAARTQAATAATTTS